MLKVNWEKMSADMEREFAKAEICFETFLTNNPKWSGQILQGNYPPNITGELWIPDKVYPRKKAIIVGDGRPRILDIPVEDLDTAALGLTPLMRECPKLKVKTRIQDGIVWYDFWLDKKAYLTR